MTILLAKATNSHQLGFFLLAYCTMSFYQINNRVAVEQLNVNYSNRFLEVDSQSRRVFVLSSDNCCRYSRAELISNWIYGGGGGCGGVGGGRGAGNGGGEQTSRC